MRPDSAGHPTDAGAPPATLGRPSPSPRALEDGPLARETLALLHGLPVAVAEHWAHEGLLVAVARLAAEDAHRAGLPVVPALITLKTAWSRLPEVRLLPVSDQRELLEHLVTGCIRAYYAPPGAAAGGVLRLLPANGPRERLDAVAAALLETVDGLVPDTRAPGAEWSHGTSDARAPSDPALEHRLDQALAGIPAEEVMALIGALRRLHASPRAERAPLPTSRRPLAKQFRPPPP